MRWTVNFTPQSSLARALETQGAGAGCELLVILGRDVFLVERANFTDNPALALLAGIQDGADVGAVGERQGQLRGPDCSVRGPVRSTLRQAALTARRAFQLGGAATQR